MTASGWVALVRKLRAAIDSPAEWRQFTLLKEQIEAVGFDGSSFEMLTDSQLTQLSAWATRARESGRQP